MNLECAPFLRHPTTETHEQMLMNAGPARRSPLHSRLLAAAVHLGVSATLALCLVVMVTKVWYPYPLFDIAKGRDIFLLLIGCDITLGPVMTLIIFNTKKPRRELARDVTIIALVQLAAMAYGVATLLKARPAYIVYNVGQFNIPLANELVAAPKGRTEEKDAAIPVAPWFGPQLVGAVLPKGVEDSNSLLFSAVSGGGDVFQMPRFFVPYSEVKSEVVSRARTVAQISKELHVTPEMVNREVASFEKTSPSIGFLPLVIRTSTALAIVDLGSGDLIGIAALPSEF